MLLRGAPSGSRFALLTLRCKFASIGCAYRTSSVIFDTSGYRSNASRSVAIGPLMSLRNVAGPRYVDRRMERRSPDLKTSPSSRDDGPRGREVGRVVGATVARVAWPAAFVAVAAMGFSYLREPQQATSEIRVEHAGATVVRELRSLARLEAASLRVEKVIELKDHQRRLRGLIDADDAILFVAAGEVVLGVDLSKLEEGDVWSDPSTGIAYVELPAPEVLSTRFDEPRSYVHSRSTDVLARRNEGLEGAARREALAAFAAAGRDPRALEASKAQAERQLRSLARAWGAKDLVITWKGPRGEVDLAKAVEPDR